MDVIRSYRDLLIWQKSMDLVINVYAQLKHLPSDEVYGLTSQIKRSVVSIPSNIAEGYGRKSKKDYVRFLRIALGSLYELQTQLEITNRLNFVKEETLEALLDQCNEIERMTNSLITKIN